MAEDIRFYTDELTAGRAEFERQYERPHCVVLDSQYCSMGRMIGMRACKAAGFAYYDAALLLDLVPEEGLTIDDVTATEQVLRVRDFTREELVANAEYQRLLAVFDKAVGRALVAGPCLIHDRTTREKVLAQGYRCVSVLTYATDLETKIPRAQISPLYEHLTEREELVRAIAEEDRIRANYHRGHAKHERGAPEQYDLMINAELFGRDYAGELLASIMR